MITFPNAKVNIGLNILKKRVDGFHEIDSVFYPVKGLHDVLEIIKSETFSFQSTGLEIPGDLEGNLCVKAYQLIAKDYQISPVTIHLHKIIPMGAGLGGGSADGAFVINMLDELFDLKIGVEEKKNYAAQLGSDCAFFIENTPANATGRGEVLQKVDLDLSGYTIVLVNPGVHIGTKEAYSGIVPQPRNNKTIDLIQSDIEAWKDYLVNDFEQSVFPFNPEIEQLKQNLYDQGAIYASMTGSGSTVYGIFEKHVELEIKAPFIWTGKL